MEKTQKTYKTVLTDFPCVQEMNERKARWPHFHLILHSLALYAPGIPTGLITIP